MCSHTAESNNFNNLTWYSWLLRTKLRVRVRSEFRRRKSSRNYFSLFFLVLSQKKEVKNLVTPCRQPRNSDNRLWRQEEDNVLIRTRTLYAVFCLDIVETFRYCSLLNYSVSAVRWTLENCSLFIRLCLYSYLLLDCGSIIRLCLYSYLLLDCT